MACDPCTPSTSDNGCVAEGAVRDAEPDVAGCQDGGPSGTSTTVGEVSTTVDPTATTTSEADTTATTTEGETSTTSGDCGPCADPTPYCVDGACVGCEELPGNGCVDLDPEATVCDPSGRCEQCSADDDTACTDEQPECIDNQCDRCDEHAQCPDSACNIVEGTCMPVEQVYYVDNGAPGCAMGDGSEAEPFCEVEDALAMVPMGTGLGTIRVSPGLVYDQQVAIASGRTVALMGWDGVPTFEPAASVDAITVENATLYIANVETVDGNSEGSGVLCDAGQLWIDDSAIRGGMSALIPGITVQSCDPVWIRRSSIVGNNGGGVDVNTSVLHVSNTFLAGNGTDGASTVPAVSLDGASSLDMVYSSVAFNASEAAGGIRCLMASSDVDVRNSIVVSADTTTIGCTAMAASVTYSAIDDGALRGGAEQGNVLVSQEFGDFFDVLDLHLAEGGPFANVARWIDGDPPTDIDGDPRPSVDGTMDYAGADLPLP
ncbi:MAG: hypothetical protein AB1Z98_01170 [Nannocystaceae bacterium]